MFDFNVSVCGAATSWTILLRSGVACWTSQARQSLLDFTTNNRVTLDVPALLVFQRDVLDSIQGSAGTSRV